ncbi:hypothetical protein WOLCODRAFT_163494 [Wolfiporia cocos MD-104 SS10]|uniref:Uncharacterized protein n=1 Tax=Wolfiporia cocos (strain MD-104) TaxID=742152 RepID=A0A2H3JIP6_WOLCO|nr:hypothetical protein WOLCODRAFT_163494 [Wolfiporia cocos MD-104 SS10]
MRTAAGTPPPASPNSNTGRARVNVRPHVSGSRRGGLRLGARSVRFGGVIAGRAKDGQVAPVDCSSAAGDVQRETCGVRHRET